MRFIVNLDLIALYNELAVDPSAVKNCFFATATNVL
jgi:hypothetical protein